MRTFEKKVTKAKEQCIKCGLPKGGCLCDVDITIESSTHFWLLTHEDELKRTTNTGRLIEYALNKVEVFIWHRTEVPEILIQLIESDDYNIYLIFSDERPEEKMRSVTYHKSKKPTAFLILDGTWKEVRKMLRKSPYLDHLPILSFVPEDKTTYNLRRNSEEHHLCTVEVGVELLSLIGETDEAKQLNEYYHTFLELYNRGRHNHE